MTDFDYDLFVIGAGSGGVRASRIAASHGAQGGGGRGVPDRRHLRDPRLRAQEAAGLWLALCRGTARCRANSAGRWARRRSTGPPCAISSRAMSTGWSAPTPRRSTTTRSSTSTNAPRWPGRTRCGWPAGARSRAQAHPDRGRRLAGDARDRRARSTASPRTKCSICRALPKRVVIQGAGYIALEFAGIFNALGSEVTVVNRSDKILRGYDQDAARPAAADHAGARASSSASTARSSGSSKQADGILLVHTGERRAD